MHDILMTALRSILAFFLLLAVARCVGRKAISQMTFFDYTVAITFGSLTASFGIGSSTTPANAATVIIMFGILAILTSLVLLKSLTLRKLANSEPIVVISKGELVKDNMQKIRMTINMLNSLLREKKVFNIADVEFAIMENDGKLSVMLKAEKQPLTPSDMGIAVPYKGLVSEVIIDGELLEENLHKTGRDENWLKQQLSNMGIGSVKDVFFAIIDSSGQLYLSLGITGREVEGKYGLE